MAVQDPRAWVANVQRLYRTSDADAVSALYTPNARIRFADQLLTSEAVHRHPHEWFGSLADYRITRTFRAAFGDIIVSETTASYIKKSVDPAAVGDQRYAADARYREFGVDIYWVNDEGRIYHKHVLEVIQPDDGRQPEEPIHE